MPRKKTTGEYITDLHSRFPDLELLGEYNGGDRIATYRCKKCGHVWRKRPNDLLCTKYGCPKCAIRIVADNQLKTHEKFICEMKAINPDITISSEYINNHTKVLCECKIDGYRWKASPSHLLQGRGCPKCGGSLKCTHDQFVSDIKKINSNISIIGNYVNDHTKLMVSCNVCANIWEAAPTHLKQGKGCPKCAIMRNARKLSKTTDQFISEIKAINPNIHILGDYINQTTKIKWECLQCGEISYSLPTNLLQGKQGCNCNKSKGENRIAKWLGSKNIYYLQEYRFDDCKDKRTLPFDFYLPNYNMCIEFDGIQHFEPISFGNSNSEEIKSQIFKDLKKRDLIKDKYCLEKDITLLRIPYWEFDNIETILENNLS